MAGCHDQVGHLGHDRVLELLRDRFFWPGMHMDVASYINSCPRCIRRKHNQIQPLYINRSYSSFRTCTFRLPSDRTQHGKHRKCIDCYRHFTRYAQAYPSKSQTALATAKLLWNNFVIHYGFPDKIISDQGSKF